MSGQEYNDGDGSFEHHSELRSHASGHLSCPCAVSHRLTFVNHQVCDLRVEWKATPEQPFLHYGPATDWTDHARVRGGSKPQRKRTQEATKTLNADALSPGISVPVLRDLRVTLTLSVLDDQGDPTGSSGAGPSVLHQLQLS